jgi:hypothetical protein
MEINNKNKIYLAIKNFYGETINPNRDWSIIIVIFIVSVIFFCIINFFIYKNTNSKELFIDISKDNIVIKKVKDNDLENVIGVFEKRKLESSSIKTLKVVDPSI